MKVKLYQCGGEKPISEFPLGLGYLQSNMRGAEVHIVPDRTELRDCDLIGLSSSAWGIAEAIDILKGSEIPVVIGGQATLWDGLQDYPFAHIVAGEGERALQRILDGECLPRVVQTPRIEDLDTLVFPNRGKCGDTIPILTARGCPWRCKFCSSSTFWGGVRFHSAEYFLAEVGEILRLHPQAARLYIMDDLFLVNRARLAEIHQTWLSRGYHKRLKLHGFVRSNTFNFESAWMMKEMGFDSVRFGAESGSDRILKLLQKQATVADHQRTIDIANHVGLPVGGSFMHGIPDETEEDRRLTEAFIRRNEGWFSVQGWYEFKAFPGTAFYRGENPLTSDMRVRE